MSAKLTLLAIGASGSIGRCVVASALSHGYVVRACIRDSHQARTFPPGVEVVRADLTRPETLSQAVAGVHAVVFTHGTYGDPIAAEAVDYGAVRNVLTALDGREVRIALMTTIGATDRRGSHDWKRRAERLVRASGQPYTIVRPSWFDYNKPDENRLVMLQGDKPLVGNPTDGAISRRQLAEVLVRSLHSQAASRKTFELHSERGSEQEDFDSIFRSLKADAPGDLDGACDLANMPLNSEPNNVLADLKAVRARSAAP